ncbi:MAG: universal stress protein [Acidobacteriota bacterium]
MMKILIAYDGSDASRTPIEDLGRAGLPRHVQAVVLAVADVWLPPETTEGDVPLRAPVVERAIAKAAEVLSATKRVSEEGAGAVRRLFPQWSVAAEAVADSPAWALIKRATGLEADLIVIGSHGYSPITNLLFGSVSLKVVAEADCSIRVGRKGRHGDGPVRILVGIDGSVDADAAITAIAQRDWPKGSEVRLLTAIDNNIETAAAALGPAFAGWVRADDDDATGWVTRMLDDAAARLQMRGLIVSTGLVEGDPKYSLLNEAESWGADTVFVGARGHSLFERLLLGSVSSAVAVRAHCSVEIVRTRGAHTQ